MKTFALALSFVFLAADLHAYTTTRCTTFGGTTTCSTVGGGTYTTTRCTTFAGVTRCNSY